MEATARAGADRRCRPAPGGSSAGLRRGGARLRAALCAALLFGVAAPAGRATAQTAAAARGPLRAYAKASPLRVYPGPSEASGGRLQAFTFGKAYDVTEEGTDFLRAGLDDGSVGYVRASHLQLAPEVRVAASMPGYRRAERGRLMFWESLPKLGEFLAADRVAQAQPDFEEAFDAAPAFDVALPIVQTDVVDVLGGSRQHRVLAVLVPVTGKAYDAFALARKSLLKTVDLHLLVDVSASTTGFVEPTLRAVAAGLDAERLRERIGAIMLTVFGAGAREAGAFRGSVSPRILAETEWHPAGLDRATQGEREPLVEGLRAAAPALAAGRGDASALVIVSGADVELSSQPGPTGRRIAVEAVDLPARGATTAIVAQVTPEPSTELRDAGRRLAVASVRYLDYSEALADGIVAEIAKLAEGTKAEEAWRPLLAPVVAASHRERMLAILPREPARSSRLVARPAYAREADWFTVQLWTPENADLLRETRR